MLSRLCVEFCFTITYPCPPPCKIEKVAQVVLINSGEKLVLTLDRVHGHVVVHWNDVVQVDLTINGVAGLQWAMKLD